MAKITIFQCERITMTVVYILLFTILGIALFVLLLYLLEPSLIALPYSFIMKLFVKNPPIVDMEKGFPQSKLLRENHLTIRKEMDALLQEHKAAIPTFHEIDKIQKYISDHDETPWRVFVLKAYGNWVESNCALVPETTKLLKELPEVTTAMFSILDGRKHIPPHRGFYKGILRYHLGLKVPEGECYIINGGQQYSWEEGKDVLFDDNFRHEVWNKTDEVRVVLFCDILRSDIPGFLKPFNQWVYRLRENSTRLKKATQKAELPVTLEN